MSNPISPELQIYSPEVFSVPNGGEMLAVRFNVASLLETKVGPEWQDLACNAIFEHGQSVVRDGSDKTVREPNGQFGFISIRGDEFAQLVPGIWELYQGTFKQMMQAALPAGLEPLHTYENPYYGLEPVAQPQANPTGSIRYRYEAHVDQRYTGVLVLDAPSSANQGGQLVISNRRDDGERTTINEIAADATRITHRPGTLVCFSRGRFYKHFTDEITDPSARRVTISLNYPVEGETPERAQEIVDHAYGINNK